MRICQLKMQKIKFQFPFFGCWEVIPSGNMMKESEHTGRELLHLNLFINLAAVTPPGSDGISNNLWKANVCSMRMSRRDRKILLPGMGCLKDLKFNCL